MAQAQIQMFTSVRRQESPDAEVMAFMQEEAARAQAALSSPAEDEG